VCNHDRLNAGADTKIPPSSIKPYIKEFCKNVKQCRLLQKTKPTFGYTYFSVSIDTVEARVQRIKNTESRWCQPV
jgi:hypothetical protein